MSHDSALAEPVPAAAAAAPTPAASSTDPHAAPGTLASIAASLPASTSDDPDAVQPAYTREEAVAAGAKVGHDIREGIKHAVGAIGHAVGIGCPSPAVTAPVAVDSATQTTPAAGAGAAAPSDAEVPHATV